MMESCTGLRLLTQSVPISGRDDDLTFSDLRLHSGQHMKSVQFMMDFDSTIICGFYYSALLNRTDER